MECTFNVQPRGSVRLQFAHARTGWRWAKTAAAAVIDPRFRAGFVYVLHDRHTVWCSDKRSEYSKALSASSRHGMTRSFLKAWTTGWRRAQDPHGVRTASQSFETTTPLVGECPRFHLVSAERSFATFGDRLTECVTRGSLTPTTRNFKPSLANTTGCLKRMETWSNL